LQACGPTIESSTRTTYWRGIYDTDPDLRAGFFRLSGRPGCPDGGKEHQPARRRLPSPLAMLYERAGLPAWPLPRVLADAYGGDLSFRQPSRTPTSPPRWTG